MAILVRVDFNCHSGYNQRCGLESNDLDSSHKYDDLQLDFDFNTSDS